MTPNATRSTLLRNRTQNFCTALLSPPPPSQLLDAYFSATTPPHITEHGPTWASSRLPFLGKTFEGKDGCINYFTVLAQTLDMHMHADTFPPADGFIVDAEAGGGTGLVSVVGSAEFSSVKTGKRWHEQFIYRFSDFDAEGRFGHWEIWADPLSAWEAVGE
ncbi:uncharacterized protein BDR25DRAFT_307401 [Lindgomyces ingoldianus]|uniref:Uncharacterized protein n=1 Tax=Lindgomyces ingoldianus TaxID=673940 RepID=A0ACB6QB69_9PLEO|nr:uncharacterized protein BDR25DRAFT_307401 [Lindgomyces ingoldianus]KAF2464100.1 hypothetical protein BDR25DRAFT_307401 [Lindgomyces ingoldianus]